MDDILKNILLVGVLICFSISCRSGPGEGVATEKQTGPAADSCSFQPQSVCSLAGISGFCATTNGTADEYVDLALDFFIDGKPGSITDYCQDDSGTYFQNHYPSGVQLSVYYLPEIANAVTEQSFDTAIRYLGAPLAVTATLDEEKSCQVCEFEFSVPVVVSYELDSVEYIVDLGTRFTLEFGDGWVENNVECPTGSIEVSGDNANEMVFRYSQEESCHIANGVTQRPVW